MATRKLLKCKECGQWVEVEELNAHIAEMKHKVPPDGIKTLFEPLTDEEQARVDADDEQCKRARHTAKRVKVGVVGVDSGQVIIADPCYIDSEWKGDTEPCIGTSVFKDKITGKRYAYIGFGIPEKMVDVRFTNYEEPLEDYNGKTPNQCREEGLWDVEAKWFQPGGEPSGTFSYSGVSAITLDEDKPYGQLFYGMGHAGVGIASRTQFGDGSYPVFADLDGNGDVARLIIDFRYYDDEKMTPEEYARQNKGDKV